MTVCGIKRADGVCVMGKCPYIKLCCNTVWDRGEVNDVKRTARTERKRTKASVERIFKKAGVKT